MYNLYFLDSLINPKGISLNLIFPHFIRYRQSYSKNYPKNMRSEKIRFGYQALFSLNQ